MVRLLGDEGYLRLTEQVLDGMDRLLAGSGEVPALHVVAQPDSTLVALGTDGSCDVFTIADEMTAAGWYVQPQLSYAGSAPTLHLTLSAATAPHVEEFLTVLGAAVETAVAAGPVAVDPGVADFVRGPRRCRPDGRGLRRPARRRGHARRVTPSPRGWPRSTPCSTSPPPRCARPC